MQALLLQQNIDSLLLHSEQNTSTDFRSTFMEISSETETPADFTS